MSLSILTTSLLYNVWILLGEGTVHGNYFWEFNKG